MNKKFWSVGMIIPLAAAAVVSTGPSAAAAPQTDPFARGVVRDIGVCTGRSDITLTARDVRLRGIVLDLRIVTNRAGQQWRVRINQNGFPLVTRVAFTRPIFAQRPPFRPPLARRAELNVRAVAVDRRGFVDRFNARATNLNTGETCTAQVVVRQDRVVRPPVRPPFPMRPPVRPPFRP